VRYLHTTLAGWMTGSLLVAGIAAWYLLKNRHLDKAQILLKTSLIIFIIASLLQLGSGHAHSVQVAKTQPEKMAAFEALWDTQEGAPFVAFGIPDAREQKVHLALKIPKMLSFLIHFDPNAKVLGLNEFPPEEHPPVFLSFTSYHVMILLGLLFIGMSFAGLYLLVRKKIWKSRWFLRLLIIAIPLPYLSNELGWIAAEVGRQPWAVYRVLKTSEAVSVVVPAGSILATLILFLLVYILIGFAGISILLRFIRKGPDRPAEGKS
jgi:cytochrome d ubiquinol oxidase subunit I